MTRAEEMRELFYRWKRSGLSLMAFGKRESVPYSQLLYWRRKFGDKVARRHSSPHNSPAPELVPISIVPDKAHVHTPAARFEVRLSNGVSFDVATGFDESELRRLVGVLLSC